ncbi:hypothetical protein GYMLUDRAFT_37719 [Collybiopsis luxurians FD-317 M1]|nr:hypothetical protein GYMLUDRAFT_37719 [Collybiopsis luxurians FD-317 M1]
MIRSYIAVLGIFLATGMVNADGQAFQPTIKGGAKKDATIRGLLGRRQVSCDPGWGFCDNTGSCCPLGGECCSDGNCCDSGFYCAIGSNGIIGCCPNGELCSGPAPGSNDETTFQQSTSTRTTTLPVTTFSTSTFSTAVTTRSTVSSLSLPSFGTSSSKSSGSSFNTASPTFFAPQATPTADSGYTNVFVAGNDPQITWSANSWSDSTSSCDSTKQSRKTTTVSSFTYLASSSSSGASLWLDVTYDLADFDIYVNGQKSNIVSVDVKTCAFYSVGRLPTTQNDINITIAVTEPLRSGRRQADNFWSFEFNGLLIGQSTSTNNKTGSSGIGAASQIRPGGMITAVIATALLGLIAWF